MSSDIVTARSIIVNVMLMREIPQYARTQLAEAYTLMHRRQFKKKAEPTASPMTPALCAEIRAYALAHPDMTNREIGRHFNVDGGRVSECT